MQKQKNVEEFGVKESECYIINFTLCPQNVSNTKFPPIPNILLFWVGFFFAISYSACFLSLHLSLRLVQYATNRNNYDMLHVIYHQGISAS